ncbi:response regulator [Cohnella sp.]|uniref:response regulator n=1 Tax=Cohnella sp. TaxID=1883426 RepID=UPI0035635C08
MKLMIVDDEVIIRNGLSTVIDWEGQGFSLLEPAASAEEAMRRVPDERPDIIFTDIRMTGQSGLEMAHAIKLKYPHTEIVVLSGYDEFTYAQQAMREGVSDYLLKTSSPNEIVGAAIRARERLSGKRELEVLGREQERLFRKGKLEQLLLSPQQLEAEDLSNLLTWFPVLQTMKDAQRLQVWQVSASSLEEDRRSDPLLYPAVGSMLAEALACEWLEVDGYMLLVVRHEQTSLGSERMASALGKVEYALRCRVYASAGVLVEDIGSLHASADAAEQAFAYRWLLAGRRVVFHSEIKHRTGIRSVCTANEEEALVSILRGADQAELQTWIAATLARVRQDAMATPASVQAYLHSLLIAGYRWLERAATSVGLREQQPSWTSLDMEEIAYHPSDSLLRHCGLIVERYSRIIVGHNAVQRAVAYIDEHLDQNLSLQQVALHVHMNPNYFSELFKREMGLNYLEFVTKARLSRAMSLLRDTPAKISEVANRIGYEDIKYFNKLFKKHTGLTPSQYRDNS